MIKSLLFTSFLSFSSCLATLNKAPFYQPQKQNDTFSEFEPDTYFNDAFDDLTGYVCSQFYVINLTQFESDYEDEEYYFYALPVYYDIEFLGITMELYYSNEYFNFYENNYNGIELIIRINILNYIGVIEEFNFGRLNSSAMSEYIYNEQSEHLTDGVISSITQWVTGFVSIIVSGLSAFVAVFYNGTNLTTIGTLALMGLGIGLVTLAIAFVTRLFKR